MASGKGFDAVTAEKTPKVTGVNTLKNHNELKPPKLGSLYAGIVAHSLAVLAPRHRTRLASVQMSGVRTIQYSAELL